jgi:signal transduction histidine kinase
LIWPIARRVAKTIPSMPARRYATAGLVAFVGVLLSLVVWLRADQERRNGVSAMLEGLADRSTGALESAMQRETDSLRGLAAVWQIHDPDLSQTWLLEAGMVLDHFSAVRWIAWVTADSTRLRFAGRDTSDQMDPDKLHHARVQLTSGVVSYHEHWTDAYALDVYQPVHLPNGKHGVLVGELRMDSVWMARQPGSVGFRSVTIESDQGGRVVLRDLPSDLAPSWMRVRRTLTSPAGGTLTVEWAPSDGFVRQIMTPWPLLFLLTGVFLSVALGILLLSFLRLRDFSEALQATNRALEGQMHELSKRDRELRVLNEELGDRVQLRTEELTQALRELEALNHSVSHDLRSPIGAILNFAAVLDEDYGERLDAEGRRFLDRIRAAAGRASQLLDSLAELSASHAGADRTRMLDMTDLAQRAFIEAAGREGDSSNVRFSVDALPAALGDPELVHRALVNLIGNALKYSRGRDVRVLHVSGQCNSTENIYTVRDNGRGFDPARATEVFEPFRRLHETDVEGSGLGLAIVAKVIGRLGGRAWAESDGVTGASFSFTLPRPERSTHGEDDPARG